MENNQPGFDELLRAQIARIQPVAAVAAVVATAVLIAAFGVHWAVAILIGEAVYAGVWLLFDRPGEQPVVAPVEQTVEELAIDRSRAAAASIAGSVAWLDTWASQERAPDTRKELVRVQDDIAQGNSLTQISAVVKEITMLMDAIEEDGETNPSKLGAAPLYATKLVDPFDQMLEKLVKMLRRRVILAADFWTRFEESDLPSFLKAAEEFYQEYHNKDVLDLAALAEILRNNLDSINDDWVDEDDVPNNEEPDPRSADRPDNAFGSNGNEKENGVLR